MKTLEASVEKRNIFDKLMAEVHEVMEHQEQCSHFSRDRIADVLFCRSCCQVLLEEEVEVS